MCALVAIERFGRRCRWDSTYMLTTNFNSFNLKYNIPNNQKEGVYPQMLEHTKSRKEINIIFVE